MAVIICLYRNYFQVLYKYLQTNLSNYTCTPQLQSQTRNFSIFLFFFPKSSRGTASSWLPGAVRLCRHCTSLPASELPPSRAPPAAWDGCRTGSSPVGLSCGVVPVFGHWQKPISTQYLSQNLPEFPGEPSSHHTGVKHSFSTDRPGPLMGSCWAVHTALPLRDPNIHNFSSERPPLLLAKPGPGAGSPHRAFGLN